MKNIYTIRGRRGRDCMVVYNYTPYTTGTKIVIRILNVGQNVLF